MSELLQQLKTMEQAGQWSEIRAMGKDALSGLEGSELARGLLAVGKAYEVTATGAADYRHALALTTGILEAVPADHLLRTWALHRIAALRADLGDIDGAEKAASEFLAGLAIHPQAQVVAPWALAAMGRVRHYQGRPGEAVAWFTRALKGDMPEAMRERVQLLLVWSLAASGRVTEAFAATPPDVLHISRGHLFAAIARTCLAARDWQGAAVNARVALRSYDAGEMLPFDLVQAAELCLISKRAATEGGRPDQAAVWLRKSAILLSQWNDAILFTLVPTLGMEGGEWIEAVTRSRGVPAGYKRVGLQGVVG